jgi:hypothetical protein
MLDYKSGLDTLSMTIPLFWSDSPDRHLLTPSIWGRVKASSSVQTLQTRFRGARPVVSRTSIAFLRTIRPSDWKLDRKTFLMPASTMM